MAEPQRGVCPAARTPFKGMFFLEDSCCRCPVVPMGHGLVDQAASATTLRRAST